MALLTSQTTRVEEVVKNLLLLLTEPPSSKSSRSNLLLPHLLSAIHPLAEQEEGHSFLLEAELVDRTATMMLLPHGTAAHHEPIRAAALTLVTVAAAGMLPHHHRDQRPVRSRMMGKSWLVTISCLSGGCA